MKTDTAISLDKSQIFSMKKPCDVYITNGELWVTYDGDFVDYFYKTGESFKVPSGKHVVVQALEKTSFTF